MTGSLTRVRNNQVYNSDIYASAKLVAKSVTGGLLSDNFTYSGNMTVGNLTVNGNTTTIDTTNLVIADPLLAINRNQSGTPTYDLGFIMGRGSATNVAMIWEETNKQFQLQYTTESTSSTTYGTINNSGYANLQAYGILLNNATISTASITNFGTGNITVTGGTLNNVTIGATTPNTGVFTTANVNGTLYAATLNAGTIGNAGATITGATSTMTSTSQAASFTTSGGGQHIGYHTGAIGANGANSGAFTTLSTSGNITAGGQMFVTGNIIPSANVTYYLGNATNRWKSLYLSANTMYLGSFSISDVNGNVSFFDEAGTSYYGLQAGYLTNTVIGNIVPASGTFTSVTAASGGQINGYLNGTIGANSANTATFTTASVNGNLTVGGNLNLTGNVYNITSNVYSQGGIFYGTATTGFNALYAGQSGYTPLAQTLVQISGNYNGFVQVNEQNTNNGSSASTDFIATANNGSDVDTYIDFGINSSGYQNATFGLQSANDGYLYVAGNTSTGGGNLVISTTTANDIIYSLGGIATANEFARMRANTNSFVISSTTAATNTTSGALQVRGGIGTNGNIYAAAIQNTPIGNGTASTGTFTTIIAQTTITSAGQVVGYINGAIGANTPNSVVATSVTTSGGGQLIGYHTGAIGANTPNSVVATSVTTSGGGQVSGYLTGAIGANTPNSVVATSVTTSSGGQVSGYLTGAIGANTANTGNFTSITTTGSGGNITGTNTGYVVAGYIVGNNNVYGGSYLWYNNNNTLASTITGTYSNSNVGGYLTSYSGALTASSVTTTGGGQLTGYLTGAIGANSANSAVFTTVSASGNITAQTANVYAANFVTNTASYSPVYYYPNGVNILSAVTSSAYSNANAAAYLTIYSGALTAANVTATGAITGNTFNGIAVYAAVIGNTGAAITASTATLTNTANSYGAGQGALQISGGFYAGGDSYITGNLIVGNLIASSQQILTVQEPLLYLSPLGISSYNYDIGIYSHFVGGNINNYQHTGLVRNYVDNDWYLFSNAAEPTGNIVNLASASLVYDTLKLGAVLIQNTTTSSSTTSGALQVSGGAGIAGALYAGSIQNTPIGSTTAASGVFTTLTASSTITGAGQVIGYFNGAIGANTANTGTFTTANVNGTLYAATLNSGTIGNSGTTFTGATSTLTGASQAASFTTTGGGQVSGYLTGALGANTPNSVVATSVTITSGGQLTGYLTGAIGANVANTGAFTTLTSSGALTSQGTITGAGQVIGYFNGAIGANSANTGAFTTLTSSGIATISGNLVAASGTTSTDTTSGALVVTGGVGVSGTLNSRGIRQYSTTANSYIGFNGGFSTEGAINSNFMYIQALSNNNASGVGIFSLNTTYNQMYSSGAIAFVTGATIRSQNTPTGGVQYVWIDAGGNLIANSTTVSTSTTTGALVVTGGSGISGNLNVGGSVYAGQPTYSDTNIKISAQASVNSYVQSIIQNSNNGTAASSDFIVNNDQSTATTYYGDFGINSSGFSGSGSLSAPNNVYVTATSSDLVLGTTTSNAIRFVINGAATDSLIIDTTGNVVVQDTTTSTSTTTGALVVQGGLGVVGNINAGSIQNTPIGNGTASTGAFTTLATSGNITAQSANVYAAYTVANTGAVATNFFYSNGVSIASTISAIQYSNTQVGAYLTVYNGNIKAAYITAVQVGNTGTLLTGTLTTNAQPYITSVGTLGSLTVSTTISGSVSGNAGSATQLQNSRNINGVPFNGTSDITITVDANDLTGTTLASGVTASSLTSVGFLDSLNVNGNINTCNSVITNSVTAGVYTQNISTYDGTGNLNVYIPQNANLTVNAGQVAANLVVHGNSAAAYQNLLVTNGATGQVGIKIAPNAITTGASFQVNSTDAMIIPSGTTANRPAGAAGMIRYNTNSNNFEYWNVGSSSWATAQGAYTTITADSFTGNGTQVDFTMSQSSTTAAVVVSINGVIQIPTTAYSVSGNTLSFTEAPLSTDIIDARIITSTTTVTSIAFGTTSISISDTGAGTGNASTIVNGTARYIANTSNYFSGGIAPMMNPVSLTQNTPTTIDSFDKATYRVAKYVIKVADTTTNRYAGAEAIVVHDGTTATASFYGLVNTGANALVSYTTTIVGNNVVLQANTWSTTAKATVFQTYMTIN